MRKVGHCNAEGPPVPIPNTEVKLCSAESTTPATAWEGRSWPTPHHPDPIWDITYGGVAQLGEHLPCKQGVMGSNPIISTKGSDEGAWSAATESRTKWNQKPYRLIAQQVRARA